MLLLISIPFHFFSRCGNNNNINNLQIDGSGEESLKDANGDEAPLFEMQWKS
jgi:hypothetical protein